jgi:TonB family protein
MFDAVESSGGRRWRTAVIVGSALAHAGTIAGLVVATMWQVEKLESPSSAVPATTEVTVRSEPTVERNVERENWIDCDGPGPRDWRIPTPPVPPPELPPPFGRPDGPLVPPNVARALRIAGDDQIHPPPSVRRAMRHEARDRLTATVLMCAGTDGRVHHLRMLRSSGYEAYDRTLLAAMRAWRYRPYRVEGRASAMCSVTVFTYAAVRR